MIDTARDDHKGTATAGKGDGSKVSFNVGS